MRLRSGKKKASFLKKRSKKLFLNWAVLVSPPQAQIGKSFCTAFFKGRLLPLATNA
jgi:hypothetical protein